MGQPALTAPPRRIYYVRRGASCDEKPVIFVELRDAPFPVDRARRYQPRHLLVLDHFGVLGRVWRETDETDANRTKLIQDLLEGQYEEPVRIVAFNTAEGWSRDVTEEIAAELAQACAGCGEMRRSIADFIADHTRPSRAR